MTGGRGKQVLFLEAQGSVVEEKRDDSRFGGRRPTDSDLVNRLDQKMMAKVKHLRKKNTSPLTPHLAAFT